MSEEAKLPEALQEWRKSRKHAGQVFPGPLTKDKPLHVAMASADSDRNLAFEIGVEKFCKEAGFDAEDTLAMKTLLAKCAEEPAPPAPNPMASPDPDQQKSDMKGSWVDNTFRSDRPDEIARSRSGRSTSEFFYNPSAWADYFAGTNQRHATGLQHQDKINESARTTGIIPEEMKQYMTPQQKANATQVRRRKTEQMSGTVKDQYDDEMWLNGGDVRGARREVARQGGRQGLKLLGLSERLRGGAGTPAPSAPPMPKPTQEASSTPPPPPPAPPSPAQGLSGQGAPPTPMSPPAPRMGQPQPQAPEAEVAPYVHSETLNTGGAAMPKPTQNAAYSPPPLPKKTDTRPDLMGVKGLKSFSWGSGGQVP